MYKLLCLYVGMYVHMYGIQFRLKLIGCLRLKCPLCQIQRIKFHTYVSLTELKMFLQKSSDTVPYSICFGFA